MKIANFLGKKVPGPGFEPGTPKTPKTTKTDTPNQLGYHGGGEAHFGANVGKKAARTQKWKCRPEPPPTPIQHRTPPTRPEHIGFGV
jgi:hypothetical protein